MQSHSVFGFSSNLGPPGPVGAVWNRTGLEKENSKVETIRQFIEN